MPLWRIQPAAIPQDSRWQDHAMWREVIVRANSAAAARIAATVLELDGGIALPGNESHGFRSAFVDEKLYWVSRLDSSGEQGEEDGPDGVVRATRWDEGEA